MSIPGPMPRSSRPRPARHKLGDGHGAVADGLGGSLVGADRVRIGVPQLEDRGEGVEPVGDLGVIHCVAWAFVDQIALTRT